MAPSKKSKYKKASRVNVVSPNKDEENKSKTRQRKRKLSDMLGPQWSKEELERFYDAYRKFGKEWKKVAAFVRTRSIEMVEALYTMNKAYLSLPEGTASVVGLIAMMTDHYTVLHGGSDSEQESNEGTNTPRKGQKLARVKSSDHLSKGLEGLSDRLQFRSSSGSLSLLKRRRTETVPRAVGKRTPRIPVSFSREKDKRERYLSPVKRGLKLKGDAIDDDMEHEIALALAEALQRGGSPQVSRTPNRKEKMYSPYKKDEKMRAEIDMAIAKLHSSDMDEGGCELSLGSTEADNGDFAGPRNYLMHGEGSSAVEMLQKGKRYYMQKLDVDESPNNRTDDVKEACSGTEEGQHLGPCKDKFEPEGVVENSSKPTYKSSRRKSKKVLFTADEGAACDALQTLADLSLMMPDTATDTESSIQVKEERAAKADESDLKGSGPAPRSKMGSLKFSKQRKSTTDVLSNTEAERKSPSSIVMRKRRQKSSPVKVPKDEAPSSSQFAESPNRKGIDEGKRPVGRGKRSTNIPNSHGKKSVKHHDHTSSSNGIVEGNGTALSTAQTYKKQVNLPTKGRRRRKTPAEKLLTDEDGKSSEILVNGFSNTQIQSLNDKSLNLKEKLSHYLSSYRSRRWCVFEWFYSAIDYPWFSRQEFVEYLDHVGLGHVPRFTRVEWGVIRSSLGKPRRFSEQFLKEEKEKLYLYRDSVRKYYVKLNAGVREGLPTDLARPLNVGQRVIALHPRTREIHDGSVLTFDHSKYRVQFDHSDLGVEFVKDTECMPLNPLQNIPASLAQQYVSLNHHIQNHSMLKMHEQEIENMPEGYLKLSCETLENSRGPHLSPSNYNISNSLKQQKGQAKEADAQALSELTRALDKKELVLSALKCMNSEIEESQKDGNKALKDSEPFKKQYAAVLFQLSEINEQVSSALLRLRQRNTYQASSSYMPFRCMNTSGDPDGHLTCLDNSVSESHDHGPHVSEIVESSRTKARSMVNRAMEAMTSLKTEKNNVVNIEEAIDFVNDNLSVDCAEAPVQRPQVAHDQLLASGPNPAIDSRSNPLGRNDPQIPSELVSRCVATLLMIQKCTERQFPPSEVAEVLDSAVASLQPSCSQNFPIYAEIQKCMGIIRNQILALVPT
ncbi:PREDICTED: protein ALWAYS EARLY 3 isoform X2 [Tarenaya hassleriana]|uniref:protein ALWAYS EARLY 3 isoform X2 n=1 Tax=Tarenaya hassleriana TaxID=28532 RepID=UPI00053C417E|nr:PREDICTED: protein ALWAYS EARLY 3 isoform X2 [Tarenaya hassleriana]